MYEFIMFLSLLLVSFLLGRCQYDICKKFSDEIVSNISNERMVRNEGSHRDEG